ncbi:DegV family protein [Deinococcus radiodurans]|jgi:EDD domain protein, DegV family|uniref:DegV domain-containing protein DR_1986 n=1 Tax=Deinococcus radiodurans (strain ATCC 13939 / DSM 20539 / JCM 16871 / CCUG 27074 / LMG 4051 / NBRC 15346 / NCIMB 9279 / VKM B-1422 / R1) TaxID=243230 RepID=Y1986_DEIRA|nr:DegV family protein [Deinococcus radiodurans]Q9RSY3.1 RecName: Full=DegV domain-containing protein DR_1986 [Deinococcus radiodurans R1 = ATCC 13939 = DSM 20539]AAF11538.1 degV protein [Deinococcus radiodurans R1 = ATCC 13939 = DSM 20539]ANC70938.1 fatty acid-binding protein DegV [Deinococcus radiodurans R1 = ATCC 13939 = DSM 20539]QEM71382.1 DegV family protein [Deinococcus radiodurans]QIP29922.1 DegV family protein [Deinococcus radiodurans]QIP31401.1 DegV family protein [Deinococcus radio
MSIAIVTDSTSDLTPEHLAALGVTGVPLYVLFEGQLYQDGVQLSARQLVEGVRAGKAIPSTSQPSPAEFAQAYAQALEHADEVLSLHISGQLSGTVGSARLAAQEFGGRVTVVDTHTVTLGLGLQVLRAAELVRAGQSVPQIVQTLERVYPQADLRFTVDTLDFLRLNGRIGGASALLGGLLNIKPLLVVRGGRVDAGGRVRGQKKALADLAEHVRRYVSQHGGARVAFLATVGGEEDRAAVRAQLSDLHFQDMGDHEIGAVVTVHAGPGAVGVALEPLSA